MDNKNIKRVLSVLDHYYFHYRNTRDKQDRRWNEAYYLGLYRMTEFILKECMTEPITIRQDYDGKHYIEN